MGPVDSRDLRDLSIFYAPNLGPRLARKWKHRPDKPELWTAGAVASARLEHHEFSRPLRQCHDGRIASTAYDSFYAEVARSRGRLPGLSSFHGTYGVARLAHRVFLDAQEHKPSRNYSNISFCGRSARLSSATAKRSKAGDRDRRSSQDLHGLRARRKLWRPAGDVSGPGK